jgi:hypothetical protein
LHSFNRLARSRFGGVPMMPKRLSCPGRWSEMLIEEHFTAILPEPRHVDFLPQQVPHPAAKSAVA